MKRVLPSLLLLVPAVGCDDARPASEAKVSAPPQVKAEEPQELAAKPALPPQARRDSPPEGMDVLAVGAPSPAMSDVPSTQGSWSRPASPLIVAFYRGHW